MSLPCMFVGAPNGNSNYGGLHVYVTACMGLLMTRVHSMCLWLCMPPTATNFATPPTFAAGTWPQC